MTLPHDVSRCAARYVIGEDIELCPMRYECKRHLAWLRWDLAAGVKDYRGIVVNMGVRYCKNKIEVEDGE